MPLSPGSGHCILSPCARRLLAEMIEFLYQTGEISGEAVFIDGTKTEACADKYTFVWKKSVSRNMEYREEGDEYLCKNGKRLTVSGVRKQKSRSGYERETTVYSCGECGGCPYKKECIRGTTAKSRWKKGTRTCRYPNSLRHTGKQIWNELPVKRAANCG